MKIAILSDIHGNTGTLDLIDKFISPNVDEIWFLGDLYYDYKNNDQTLINRKIIYEFIKNNNKFKLMLKGNCDLRETSDLDFFHKEIFMTKNIFDMDFFLCHGNTLTDISINNFLDENKCKGLISGHTHIGKIEIKDEKILLNPGSVSYPRDDNKIPSYIIIQEEKKLISLISLDTQESLEELRIYS
jgi:uncharacterized protein